MRTTAASAAAFGFLVGLCLAPSARAQDPITVVVAPFGEAFSEAAALSEEIELELTLDEGLLLTPADDVAGALKADNFRVADDQDIGQALEKNGQQVLIRGRPLDDGDEVVILIHRAPDGEVIFARKVTPKALLGSAQTLATELAAVVKDVEVLDPLPAGQVKELLGQGGGRRVAGGDGDGDGEPDEGPSAGTDEDPERTPTGTGTTTPEKDPGKGTTEPGKPTAEPGKDRLLEKVDDEKKQEAAAGPKLFDKLIRAQLRWTPPFYRYTACNPAPAATEQIPFLCQGGPLEPPQTATILPWLTPASIGFGAEAYPWIPWVGLHVDGYVFRTVIGINPPDLYNRPDLEVLGGQVAAHVVARGAFGIKELVGVAVGGRVGFISQFMLVSDHFIQQGGDQLYVTLLPDYTAVMPTAGAHASVSILEYARLSADLDVIPVGLTFEAPTLGAGINLPFGSATTVHGGRLKLQVDGHPLFGIMLSGGLDTTVLYLRGQGEGQRISRNLQSFRDGQGSIFMVQPFLGAGYRF